MSSIIDSGNNSQTLQTLWQSKKSEPYEYKIIGNFCNGARSISRVTANQSGAIAAPAGIEVVFPIPKVSYYLQFIVVRSKVITAADESAIITSTSEFGLRLFSRKELRTNGKVFWKSDPYNDQVRNDLDPFSKSQAYSCLSEPLFTNDGAAPVFNAGIGFYVSSPIYAPYFDKTYMYLDSVYLAPMELGCIVETTLSLGLNVALASILPEAYMFFRSVDNESYVLTKKLNFKEGEPTTMLGSSTFTEAIKAIADDAVSTTLDIKCKNVAQTTSFFLVNSGAQVPTKKMAADATHCIYKFDFLFAGQNVITGMPTDVLALDRAYRYDSANILCSNVGALTGLKPYFGPHTLYWSEMADRTYNSHALAYYNGGQPQLIVYHPDLGATYSLICVHDIFGFLTIDSSNGTMEFSTPT